MDKRFPQYDELDLPKVADEVLKQWEAEDTFGKSLELRKDAPPFVFYEGPPSANGLPGIHHVMARAIKDIFCRYQTQKGKRVDRKAGWDTHGLPIELGVEKELGITKEDIGKKISIEEYNAACKKAVMRYTDVWNDLTRRIGFWLDLEHPYVTYHTKYIESVWHLLKKLYDDQLLYKGYTIQPYSPAAGTGLSSHELNQPGTYKPVKDTSVTAMFRVSRTDAERLFGGNPQLEEYAKELNRLGLEHDLWESVYMLAWTTTPWTLPANAALAVGADIEYILVATINPYTRKPAYVILAKDRFINYFPTADYAAAMTAFHAATAAAEAGTKPESSVEHSMQAMEWASQAQALSKAPIPVVIFKSLDGFDLAGTRYVPLFDDLDVVQKYARNNPTSFQVITGDFVSTEDGTGIVHISPTFGSDDKRVADKHEIVGVYVSNRGREEGSPGWTYDVEVSGDGTEPYEYTVGNAVTPIVDRQGRYVPQMGKWAGRYVKNYTDDPNYVSLDVDLSVDLKQRGLAFKVEKYEHNYPHCWRTDKPVLYYPLDSWFVRVTAKKDRLIALNKTINWKPESTGTGRFGNWLENLQDWNLSRSRYWGIPLPIWRTEDGDEELCIGSLKQLKEEIMRAVKAGVMKEDPYASFKADDMSDANYHSIDIHRPYVDNIVLVSPSGKPMKRETDLIDVWFDSGAMPYAQWHYPFENEETFKEKFPAAFIAEGVDQTRGWFYTLHAIATLTQDSVAYKAVVSNGLVLDKVGQKMSKRLGNAVDPFKTLDEYGADAVRWYMISNASPWDNLKFDAEGITEVQRKFFRALFNTYNFFALYANIDGYEGQGPAARTEMDRWILSRLNSLIKQCDWAYADYEPTIAARAVQDFVVEDLSNWYVRLNRRRFWKGEMGADKNAAFQTLHRCLEVVAMLSAPIAPFFSDRLHRDLCGISVHLSDWPKHDEQAIDLELEQRTALAQKLTSLVLSIRKKEGHRVRQPLQKMLVPVTDASMRSRLDAIRELVLSEVNVKELVILDASESKLTKKIKPDFKKLGSRMGRLMKSVASTVVGFSQSQIAELEANGSMKLTVDGSEVELLRDDVEITAENVPGLSVASDGALTVALDITLSDELRQEGLARELVSRIQTLRKESGFEVTDRVQLHIQDNGDPRFAQAVRNHAAYIVAETLAVTPEDQVLVGVLSAQATAIHQVELDEATRCALSLVRSAN